MKKLLIFLSMAIIALGGGYVMKEYVISSYYIPSSSMYPTLNNRDLVIGEMITPKEGNFERGDIIVFQDYEGWIPDDYRVANGFPTFNTQFDDPDLEPPHLIKRIVGLPGDEIVCCDYNQNILLNGKILEEYYLPEGITPSEIWFSVVVPEDSYWVMGDNRPESSDSRLNQNKNGGFVTKESIQAKIFLRLFPLDELRSF